MRNRTCRFSHCAFFLTLWVTAHFITRSLPCSTPFPLSLFRDEKPRLCLIKCLKKQLKFDSIFFSENVQSIFKRAFRFSTLFLSAKRPSDCEMIMYFKFNWIHFYFIDESTHGKQWNFQHLKQTKLTFNSHKSTPNSTKHHNCFNP